MNSEVANKLISILSKPKKDYAKLLGLKAAHELLKTFIIRGYFHLYKTLGHECISFLQSLGQSGDLMKSLLEEAMNDTLTTDKHIVSETQLEMMADSARNHLTETEDLKNSHRFEFTLKEGENAFTIYATDYRHGYVKVEKDFPCLAIHGRKESGWWSSLIPP